jgi:hypothetical protein
MKTRYPLFTAIGLFVIGSYITTHNKVTESKPFERVATDTVHLDTVKIVNAPKKIATKKLKPRIRGDIYAFMKRLGRAEGLGDYGVVSKTGYLGLYQFHPKTLRSLGFDVSPEEFLASPSLQDSAMIAYMRMNARELNGIIRKYAGTTVNGVYVTKAGILAGAHLVGSGGILAFFYPEKYDYRVVDGNGVHVSQYMTKFAGYDLRGL